MDEYDVQLNLELIKLFEDNIESSIMSPKEFKVKSNCTFHDLNKLEECIKNFFLPIEHEMVMFVYFKAHGSVFFDAHLKSQLKSNRGHHSTTVENLGLSLTKTKEVIMHFMDGSIKYNELILNGELKVQIIFDEEMLLQNALDLNFFEICSPTGFQDLSNLSEVFGLSYHAATLHEIFARFKLEHISRDDRFIDCYEMTSKFREDAVNIDTELKTAKKLLDEIRLKFCLNSTMNIQCLNILVRIRDSPELHKFIEAKKFFGEKGLDSFRQQYQLITTRLQHMDYDESVLNNLPGAVKLISPLYRINESESRNPFKDVMYSVLDNSNFNTTKLQNVNKNMGLIQRWFSHADVSFVVTAVIL